MSQDIFQELFPEISDAQHTQLCEYASIFREWNSRINLVSRKDIEALELHHICHSLSLIKWLRFEPRTRVLDVGTGGGLPGIPLAILHPEASFFLCDSIAKKAKALEEMVAELGLKNVSVVRKRAETLESSWDFILGRAVTSLPRFLSWIKGNIRKESRHEDFPNGVIYWKGSLYRDELDSIGLSPTGVFSIEEAMPDPYFAEKFIVHLDRGTALKAPNWDE